MSCRFDRMRYRGTVFAFDGTKGFGFVADPEPGDHDDSDVFVHVNEIDSNLRAGFGDGAVIEYELVDGERGLRAEQVEVVSGSSIDGKPMSYEHQVVDALLECDGTLTAAQITNIRAAMVKVVMGRGWIEDAR